MTFARAEPPAHDKKGKRYTQGAGKQITDWVGVGNAINWPISIVTSGEGDKRVGYRQALPYI